MSAGEKACPRCKGAISKAAHLCKHCGYRFSEAEIASGTEQMIRGDFRRFAGIGCLATIGVMLLLFAFSGSRDAGSLGGAETAGPIQSGAIPAKAQRDVAPTGSIAPDAVSKYTEADRKHYPKLFARLGDRVFEAERLGHKAAQLAIRTSKCDRVVYVDVSESSTRDDLQFFVDCDNETRVRVSESEIKAGLVNNVETRSDRMAKASANVARYDALIAKAKDVVRASLRDPNSAEYGPMTVSTKNGTAVCGTVNARNGFGGMSGQQPFVAFADSIVTPRDADFATKWQKHCT